MNPHMTDSGKVAGGSVEAAGAALADGRLVVFPTETVYGLGAFAMSDGGVERLRVAKGRAVNGQPFTVHLPDAGSAGRYVDMEDRVVRRLVTKLMPGPVTLVVRVSDAVMEKSLAGLGLPMAEAGRIYFENTIGLRCPAHELGRAVLGAVDGPVVASSANLRGAVPPRDFEEAREACLGLADVFVDGGACRVAKPSTIVKVGGTIDARKNRSPRGGEGVGVGEGVRGDAGEEKVMVGDGFEILREGVVDARYIRKLMQRKLLVVCSGNTCRSPMAAGLAAGMLGGEVGGMVGGALVGEVGGEVGVAVGGDVTVMSAGTSAWGGNPASAEAITAMAKMGVDISKHRSTSLDAGMVHEADVILCMTAAHREGVLSLVPGARAETEAKTRLLDPSGGDVVDPYGQSAEVYEACAARIRELLMQTMKELDL